MTTWRLAALAMLVAVDLAAATDVPIPGKTAGVSARNPARRTFSFRSAVTPAIAAPFPDPTAGASLRVFVSSAPGQCNAEIELPAAFWTPISGNGALKGWRYRDKTGSAQGIRAVTVTARSA